MIGAVSYNLGYIGTGYRSGATIGAARTAAAANLEHPQSVTPVSKTPEVYSNVATERIPRTPAEQEQARKDALEFMKGSAARDAEHINAPHTFRSNGTGEKTEELRLPGVKDDSEKKPGRASSPEECETCKHRTYVDGSNESDVSFKTPGHIDPKVSGAVVMAHERQHVSNAIQEGNKPDAQLVSATVTLKTAICPECGTTYVAGGTTHTSMRHMKENPYVKAQNDFEAFQQTQKKPGVDFAA